MTIQRRSFLKLASLTAAGNLAGLKTFGNISAMAATTSGDDYKALVCVLLAGGNDANNMVIPADAAGYAQYSAARKGLAIPKASLLGLNGTTLGLNPNMPELQQLFLKNNAAILANTGSLVAPLTRAEYLAGSTLTPQSLFSHSDQQAFIQTEQPASAVASGWGGRIADVMDPAYGTTQLSTVVSVSGSHVFGNGKLTQGYAVNPGTAANGLGTCWEGSYCSGRLSTAQQMLSMSSGATLVQADQNATANIYRYANNLTLALKAVTPVKPVFPAGNPLTAQLQQIMQIMQVRSSLGARRQIFFVTLNGFDTHGGQLGAHNLLLSQLSGALGAFYSGLESMGLGSQVTTFTVSDFGRAFEPNSEAGSDHAWGSHHIIMGDAVKGGKVYGTFQDMTLGGQNDAGSNGRWIPTTSTTQYAATLASWFGVPASELATVFPLSSEFSKINLGFV